MPLLHPRRSVSKKLAGNLPRAPPVADEGSHHDTGKMTSIDANIGNKKPELMAKNFAMTRAR